MEVVFANKSPTIQVDGILYWWGALWMTEMPFYNGFFYLEKQGVFGDFWRSWTLV